MVDWIDHFDFVQQLVLKLVAGFLSHDFRRCDGVQTVFSGSK